MFDAKNGICITHQTYTQAEELRPAGGGEGGGA